jgi:type IV secretory pathway VirB2 component (pilin)
LTAVSEIDRKAAIRFIICLGVVSMFADMTYEGAHSVIGPLLSDLGSSATQVGFIAGSGRCSRRACGFFRAG